MEDFTVVTKVRVSKEQVKFLIIGALEGGSNYWYRIEEERALTDHITTDACLEKAFSAGGLNISDYNGCQYPKALRRGNLNPLTIEKALNLMAEKFPKHFADILSDNADANTDDLFLQLAVLGDVIYG
jgi:hypothetical protein